MTLDGVAFTSPTDGDARHDPEVRRRGSARLGIPDEWATVNQVHGPIAIEVDRPGEAGEGDALVTTVPNLPLAVFTADCLGVVLHGPGTVGVAHAGWRGLAAGVLDSTISLMEKAGAAPTRAEVGPGIGPCCFEVGDEVAEVFREDVSSTTWGTRSVDLRAAAARRLRGMDVWIDDRCTACGGGFSHRRTGTTARMAALGWVP